MRTYYLLITYAVCPRSLVPFYIVTYYIKWLKTSWTYCSTNCTSVQVLVRVLTAGVNPVETYIREGQYSRLPELPYTPGSGQLIKRRARSDSSFCIVRFNINV